MACLHSVARALALLLWGVAASAQTCPNPDGPDTYGTYAANGTQLLQPRSFALQAGGTVNIVSCANVQPRTDRGPGYVTTNPDVSFKLSGMGAFRLDISVVSACDAILLINTGSVTWYYDDDHNRASAGDPMISLTRPVDGRIDIWVGTFDGSRCGARLTLETFYR